MRRASCARNEYRLRVRCRQSRRPTDKPSRHVAARLFQSPQDALAQRILFQRLRLAGGHAKVSMEPHLRVDRGITVSRCDYFVLNEVRSLTPKQSEPEGTEGMPPRLFLEYPATLKFSVTDSFGQDAEARRKTSPDWFRFVCTQPWEVPAQSPTQQPE